MENKFDLLKITGLKAKKNRRDKKYATFNRRMLAATIDTFLLSITVAPLIDYEFVRIFGPVPVDVVSLQQLAAAQSDPHQAAVLFWHTLFASGFLARWLANFLLQMLALCAFSAVFWHYWAATPGKMLLRLKIVDEARELPISDKQIGLRLLGYIPSALVLFIGFFMIAFDKRGQGWHDKLAKTVVIVLPWRRAKSGSPAADPSDSPAP